MSPPGDIGYAPGMAERARPRELSDLAYMTAFWHQFGTRRALQLLGWMAWSTAAGQPTLADVVSVVRRTGISRAATYRAIADVKEWRETVAKLEGREVDEMPELDELVRDLRRRLGEMHEVRSPWVQPALLDLTKENPPTWSGTTR